MFRLIFKCGLSVANPAKNELCKNYNATRNYASKPNSMKVSIIGAAGEVGQALALMLKQSPLLDELCLYDLRPTKGIAMELSHIDTKCKVTAFSGKKNIQLALRGSQIVVVTAAKPQSSSLTHQEMFEMNAPVVQDVIMDFAQYCPRAFLALWTKPVDCMVPMASEILKKSGYYNPKTVFGVITWDVVRANTLVAEVMGVAPECVAVPLIGGQTEHTLVPVLSQAKPCAEFTLDELEDITLSIKKGHEIVNKLAKHVGAKLSEAFSVARFTISLMKAIKGESGIVECAFVKSNDNRIKYMTIPVLIGSSGIVNYMMPKPLTDYEKCQFGNAMQVLKSEIEQGELFLGVVDPPPCDPCDPRPHAPRCPADYCEKACK